jgi:hypothetical protein
MYWCNVGMLFKLHITQCGYEVPGVTLLHDLKGAMQFYFSKDMSVHVCFYISSQKWVSGF